MEWIILFLLCIIVYSGLRDIIKILVKILEELERHRLGGCTKEETEDEEIEMMK